MADEKIRSVIIGLDGVPYGLLRAFAEEGVMPNTADLMENGTLKKMKSSIPEISSVAWSSVITGVNPGEHGIFGFTDIPPNTYRLTFPNFNNLKVNPFWEKDGSSSHILINIPSTYPARGMNGVLISGFVALDLEKAVFPKSLIPHLEEIDYRVDVDSGKAHESMELFIKDLNVTNEARIAAYRRLWERKWDTFMLVFTGTDRLMHFLWDAYEDKTHVYGGAFRQYFRRVDEIIGEIAGKIKETDDFIMLSDHGFERLDEDVYINAVLAEERLLSFESGKEARLANISSETKAFALDPARIYVNLEGRYPRGGVKPSEKETVIERIIDIFGSLSHEGRRVIKSIYSKDDIYSGAHREKAPDIVLMGEKGFNLKAAPGAGEVFSKGIFTGKHSYDDAFLFINRKEPQAIMPDEPTVSDVLDIMNRMKEGSVYEGVSQ